MPGTDREGHSGKQGGWEAMDLYLRARYVDQSVRIYGELPGDAHPTRAEQGMALAKRLDDPAAMAHVLYGRGLNEFALGQWQRARSDFERVATLVGSTGQFLHAPYPLHGLGLLCLAEGREEEAIDYLNQALTLAQRNHDNQVLCAVLALLAEWDLLAGRAASAQARLLPLLETLGPLVSYSKEAFSLLAWTYLALGEIEQARVILGDVLSTARQAQMRPALVQAMRVQALLLSKEGSWEEVEQVLRDALSLCRRMAASYAEAKVLYTAGVISYGKGELSIAHQQLETAQEICDRLGERLYASRIEQTLTELL